MAHFAQIFTFGFLVESSPKSWLFFLSKPIYVHRRSLDNWDFSAKLTFLITIIIDQLVCIARQIYDLKPLPSYNQGGHLKQHDCNLYACSKIKHRVVSRDARPTPPGPRKNGPCPAPQKLTKTAGRNGAKLTVDNTDYAHTFGLTEWGNEGKAVHLVFCTAFDYLVCRKTI